MAPQVAERLSALARDHAEGRMTLEAYRRLRGPLLDSLVGITDESASVVTQPRARMAQPEGGPLPKIAPPQRSVAPQSASPQERLPKPHSVTGWRRLLASPGGRTRLAGASGALLVIAVFLIWHAATRTGAPVPVAPAGAPGAATVDPIRALLQPLVDDPDWSGARLAALNDALVGAGPARIAAARNADWFNAFVDQVRSRVKEQQALADAPLSPDKSPLAALAVTLGIDLASPDRPIRIGAGESSDMRAIERHSRATLRDGSRGP